MLRMPKGTGAAGWKPKKPAEKRITQFKYMLNDAELAELRQCMKIYGMSAAQVIRHLVHHAVLRAPSVDPGSGVRAR